MDKHFMRFTSEQNSLGASSAMRCHHDEIASLLPGSFNYRCIRVAARYIGAIKRHTGVACRLFDHRKVLLRLSFEIRFMLLASALHHHGWIRDDGESRDHVQSSDLCIDALGERNALLNRRF